MNAAFADTSYYLAIVGPNDQWHAAAVAWGARHRGPCVTTDYVLTELGNTLVRGDDRRLFLDLLSAIRGDANTTVVAASAELMQAGVDLFAKRPDKTWSLTDCTSFVSMTGRGLTDALTADHHFVQAGFRALLLESPDVP